MSKPECHLCEIAYQELLELRRQIDFVLEVVEITQEPALFKQYFEKIPVVIVDDHITFAAPIRMDQVRAALIQSRY